MLKFLRHPYPIVDASKRMVTLIAVIVFSFVFLFISVFKPFNIEQAVTVGVVPAALMFAAFSSGFYLLYVKLTMRLFASWIRDENWNVGKELLYINSFLILLCIGNTVLRSSIAPTPERSFWENVLDDLFYTYSIALFPIAAIITIRYINDLKDKRETLVPDGAEEVAEEFIEIRSQTGNNDIMFRPNEILFLKSEGNYVEFYLNQGEKVERIVRRNTLGFIQEQVVDYDEFFRSHRQYIVNTSKIVEVKGNAQGYKLRLDGVEDLIPVSRNNVEDFKRRYK